MTHAPDTPAAPGDLRARRRSLIAAIACASLSGAGFGLLMPLVSLNLEAMTGSGLMAGANGAAAALSTILAAPFVPVLLRVVPFRTAVAAACVIVSAGMLLFPLLPDPYVWLVLRVLLGMAVTVVFVVSETWINQLARPESRATLLAVYATALSAGFGSGGLVLALVGSQGVAPWIACAGLYALGLIPILGLRGPGLTAPPKGEAGLRHLVTAARIAPAAILAGVLFGALETGFFSLYPVYADRLGLSTAAIGGLVMAGAAGGICLQIPIGRLADKIGPVRTLAGIALACAAIPLLMSAAGAAPLGLFPLTFLFVGAAGAFYTVGLALVGRSFDGASMATANAAFVFAYGLGSLAGPPLGGVAMDAVNPQGLLYAASAAAAAYLAANVLISRRARALTDPRP